AVRCTHACAVSAALRRARSERPVTAARCRAHRIAARELRAVPGLAVGAVGGREVAAVRRCASDDYAARARTRRLRRTLALAPGSRRGADARRCAAHPVDRTRAVSELQVGLLDRTRAVSGSLDARGARA